eukprot:scaffold23658_cov61-Phaeocystis_antarctica.AAC.14
MAVTKHIGYLRPTVAPFMPPHRQPALTAAAQPSRWSQELSGDQHPRFSVRWRLHRPGRLSDRGSSRPACPSTPAVPHRAMLPHPSTRPRPAARPFCPAARPGGRSRSACSRGGGPASHASSAGPPRTATLPRSAGPWPATARPCC